MPQLIMHGSETLRINSDKNKIEVSKDGGRNWMTRFLGSGAGTFYSLCSYGSVILACTSKGVYVSKDSGRNWISRFNGTSCGTFQEIAANGSELLATTSKGLYRSKDEGRNWIRR